jgi:hypothetical protein
MSEENHRPLDPEVLTEAEAERLRASADFLARILDSAFRIPGTRLTVGLDPLIGLLPGLGDVLAGAIGTLLLVMAVRLGVPRIVLLRMSLNVLANGIVGAIPGVGDAFSFWFKSNQRNAALLHRASAPRASTAGDWLFVGAVLLGTVAALLGAITLVLWVIARVWDLVR